MYVNKVVSFFFSCLAAKQPVKYLLGPNGPQKFTDPTVGSQIIFPLNDMETVSQQHCFPNATSLLES